MNSISNLFLRRFRSTTTIPIPHRSLPEPRGGDEDFIAIAHSHVANNDWPNFLSLVPSLSPFRLSHLLLRLRGDPTLSFSLYNNLISSSYFLSILPLSILLHSLSSSKFLLSVSNIIKKCLDDENTNAHQLFDELLNTYRLCDSQSPAAFDCLFSALARRRKFRDATETFRRMNDYGFLPNIRSCNAYISSLLALGRGDILLSFYREMRRSRISPNVYTINMVMQAMLRGNGPGKLEKAAEMFGKMEDIGVTPNVASWNTLIDGYCRNGLTSDALKLKNKMDSKGLRPNEITYNSIVHGFCREGKLRDANRVVNEMKVAEVSPNTVTYNTLISGYGRTNNSEMGMRLYEEMMKSRIEVDIVTYNSLISGLCNEGKTKKAALLVKELDAKGLVPDEVTYIALMSGQCKRQNSERAFQIYKALKRSGCRLNCRTFKMLISTFGKNKDFDGALQMVKEMKDGWITPEKSLLAELAEELHHDGKSDMATKLFSEIYRGRQNSGCAQAIETVKEEAD